jgi:hypothetical protein
MRRLGLFRGLAAIAIVLSHSTLAQMVALGYWAQRFGRDGPVPDLGWIGSSTYYGLIGVLQLSLFGVPVFIFASGFHTQYSMGIQSPGSTYRALQSWLVRLISPLLIWLMISTILHILSTSRPSTSLGEDALGFVVDRVKMYYFPFALGELLLVAPVLVRIAKRNPILLLALSSLLTIVDGALQYLRVLGLEVGNAIAVWDGFGWVFIWRFVFFFSLGLVVSQHKSAALSLLKRLRPLLTIACLLFLGLSIVESDWIYGLTVRGASLGAALPDSYMWKLSTNLYATAAILLMYSLDWRHSRLSRLTERLGVQSYGIYLVHYDSVGYMARVVYHAAPLLLPLPLVMVPILLVSGIGLPYLLQRLFIQAPVRGYSRLVFGA